MYNFMVGFPIETFTEIKKTLKLAVKLLKDNPQAMVSVAYVAIPYPGTELYQMAL